MEFVIFFFLCSYKSLDVKNILLETVSNHVLPQMLASPLWPGLNSLLREYLKFMDDHFRESADLTFLAYRHRNYSKVSWELENIFFHIQTLIFLNGFNILPSMIMLKVNPAGLGLSLPLAKKERIYLLFT